MQFNFLSRSSILDYNDDYEAMAVWQHHVHPVPDHHHRQPDHQLLVPDGSLRGPLYRRLSSHLRSVPPHPAHLPRCHRLHLGPVHGHDDPRVHVLHHRHQPQHRGGLLSDSVACQHGLLQQPVSIHHLLVHIWICRYCCCLVISFSNDNDFERAVSLDLAVLRPGDGPAVVLWPEQPGQDPVSESTTTPAEGDETHLDCYHGLHPLLAAPLEHADHSHLRTSRFVRNLIKPAEFLALLVLYPRSPLGYPINIEIRKRDLKHSL